MTAVRVSLLITRDFTYAWRCGPRWIFWYLRAGRFIAALRTVWFTLVCGHIGEACGECGRPYLRWRADDALYATVTGRGRYATGESAPGLYCLECFSEKAYRAGIVLRWVPEVSRIRDDSASVEPIPWSSPIADDVVRVAYKADPSVAIIERVQATEKNNG